MKATLAYGFIQIPTTIVSATALAAVALNLRPLKLPSKAFNNCTSKMIPQGEPNSQDVRHCYGF
jgi:hypothetical protein